LYLSLTPTRQTLEFNRLIKKMTDKKKEKKFKFASIQLMVTADKNANLENAQKKNCNCSRKWS